MTVGDSNSPRGWIFAGALVVGSNQVILHDTDRAELGALTTLAAGGRLHAANGFNLDGAKTLTATGDASIDGDFTNDGTVNGPTAAGEQLIFKGDANGRLEMSLPYEGPDPPPTPP